MGAGYQHAFAQRADAKVYGFGDNGRGQLALGQETADYPAPTVVTAMAGATAVAGGFQSSAARFASGAVKTAGLNSYGQLGDGTTTRRARLVDTGITNATTVVSGGYHSLALASDGTVWAWGRNLEGQLGDGTTTNRSAPVQVTGLTGVVAVAAGWEHSLAIKGDGTLWAWGYNSHGQMGDGTKANKLSPAKVSGLSNVVSAAGGVHFTVAVLQDGTVWSWGDGQYGQLGQPVPERLTPSKVNAVSGIKSIAAGSYHVVAAGTDGRVWAWGHNSSGQLGQSALPGQSRPQQSNAPLEVKAASGASAVGASGATSYAVRNGELWGWGANSEGQLGNGTTTTSESPVLTGCPVPGKTPWALSLTANPPVATPGSPVTLTAIANQDVADTGFAISLFDEQSGLLLASCTSGLTCSAIVTSPTMGSRGYVAYVAAPSATNPPTLVQTSAKTNVTWGPTMAGPYSGSCTSPTHTVVDQTAAGKSVLLKVQQVSADETWICFRVNDANTWAGGRVSVVAPAITAPAVAVDDNSGACAATSPNTAPGPHPVTGGEVGDGENVPVTAFMVDTHSGPGSAWVCLDAGDVHKRVLVGSTIAPPAVITSIDGQ